MGWVDYKLIKDFFVSNPDFIEISDTEIRTNTMSIGDYIYISCYVKTQSSTSFDVIYESGRISSDEQALIDDSYWSPFNKGYFAKQTEPFWVQYCKEDENPNIVHEGIGAALVILDRPSMSIQKVYYFKDTYNMPGGVSLIDVVSGKLVVQYFEHHYVFDKENFTGLVFINSYKYLKLDYLWIAYPHEGYDEFCNWHLINFRENKEQPIYALTEIIEQYPQIQNCTSCWYDFERNVFIFEMQDESIAMDFNALSIKKENIHLLKYTDIGTAVGRVKVKA